MRVYDFATGVVYWDRTSLIEKPHPGKRRKRKCELIALFFAEAEGTLFLCIRCSVWKSAPCRDATL